MLPNKLNIEEFSHTLYESSTEHQFMSLTHTSKSQKIQNWKEMIT